jgi:hypothetical protein
VTSDNGIQGRASRSATACVSVIGPRTVAQLDDYLAALEIILDDEAFRRMDKPSTVPLGQPHDLIASMLPRLLGDGPADVPAPAIPVA